MAVLRALVVSGLWAAGLVLAASSCAEGPGKLSEERFGQIREPFLDAAGGGEDTPGGGQCPKSCGGLINPGVGFVGPSWQTSGDVTLDPASNTATFVADIDAPAEVFQQGPRFEGAVSLSARVAARGRMTVGLRDGATGARMSVLVDSVGGIMVRQVDGSGAVVAESEAVAYAELSEVEVRLETECSVVRFTVDDGPEQVFTMGTIMYADQVFMKLDGPMATGSVGGLNLETECGDAWIPGVCEEDCAALVETEAGCQVGLCSALGACFSTVAADGASCSDGDSCTGPDQCEAGACQAGPFICAEPIEGYAAAQQLTLFEPLHGGTGIPSSVTAPERQDWQSNARRLQEPVDIPLVNGSLDGVQGYFPLDGGFEGGLTQGYLPSSIDATAATWEPGLYGQALRVPEGELIIGAPQPTGVPFTLMVWVELDGDVLPDHTPILGWFPQPGAGATIIRLAQDQGTWQFEAEAVEHLFGAAKTGWTHLAVTWDPGSLGRMYQDGVLVDTFEESIDAAAPLTIPAPKGGPDGGRTGDEVTGDAVLDDLVYLHRALTSGEVADYVRSGRPYGSPLAGLSEQRDWDDVRVTVVQPDKQAARSFELIGRRALSDTAPVTEGVAAYWRFDGGSSAATLGEASSTIGLHSLHPGAFDDDAGALEPTDDASRLWTDRAMTLDGDFAIELWVRLPVGTDMEAGCAEEASATDGLALLQTAFGDGGGAAAGWVLRVCAGAPVFEHRDGETVSRLSGPGKLSTVSWNHLLVDVGAETWTLYVNGVAEASVAAPEGPLADGMHPLSLGVALGPDGSPGAVTRAFFDDLIVHAQTRGAGYAWSRVSPVVPSVRLLVNTSQGGLASLEQIAVHTGSPDASAFVPEEGCASALSACNGVMGWWRFDQVAGWDHRLSPDLSDGGRHALLPAGATPAMGPADGALELTGEALSVLGEGQPMEEWTVELLLRPSALSVEQVPLWMGQAEGEGARLSLGASHVRVTASGVTVSTSRDEVDAGAWALIGGALGGGSLVVSTPAGDVSSVVSNPQALPFETLLIGTDLDGSAAFVGAVDEVRVVNRVLEANAHISLPRLSWKRGRPE